MVPQAATDLSDTPDRESPAGPNQIQPRAPSLVAAFMPDAWDFSMGPAVQIPPKGCVESIRHWIHICRPATDVERASKVTFDFGPGPPGQLNERKRCGKTSHRYRPTTVSRLCSAYHIDLGNRHPAVACKWHRDNRNAYRGTTKLNHLWFQVGHRKSCQS